MIAHVLAGPPELALSPLRTPESDAAWWLLSVPDWIDAQREGLIHWQARMLRRWTTAHALGWPHDVDPHRAAAICEAAWRAASCTDGSPTGDEGGGGSDEAVGSVTGGGKPLRRRRALDSYFRTHGLSQTPEYRAWQTMRLRCTDPSNPAWANYGGRGITVCARWLDSPETFVADMGPKPTPKHELDRIDNDDGYEPGNCRWATRSENDRNRRSTCWVVYCGERHRLIDLCDRFGVRTDTAKHRIGNGWTVEAAVETPARPKAPNGSRTAGSGGDR